MHRRPVFVTPALRSDGDGGIGATDRSYTSGARCHGEPVPRDGRNVRAVFPRGGGIDQRPYGTLYETYDNDECDKPFYSPPARIIPVTFDPVHGSFLPVLLL